MGAMDNYLTRALGYYRRLCRVPEPESAELNRLSALPILREALHESPRLEQCLLVVAERGEVDSPLLRETLRISLDDGATNLARLWQETVEIRGTRRGLSSERIFLERRADLLPKGGRVYRYRLSELGQHLMEDSAC